MNNKQSHMKPQLSTRSQQQPTSVSNALFIIISALLCFGALMVFSAGAGIDQHIDIKHFWKYATMRRIAFVPIVLFILAVSSRMDYHKWIVNEEKFWLSPVVYMTMFSVILLVMVLIPGVGTEVHSSRRWLQFGPPQYGLRIQPSELAKWSTVMFLACWCSYKKDDIRKFWSGFVPGCLLLGIVAGLIGKEDFGTAALVGTMGIVVMLTGGVRWYYILLLIPIAAIAFYVLVYNEPYRWERVLAYWNGTGGHTSAANYQAHQSIMAIGSGGIWGVGLGQGVIKCGYLPEDTTDFIFAIIGEELGLAGCLLVISLFAGFLICGIIIAKRAKDNPGRLLAIAIAGTVGTQAAINLMVVTGMAPTKGIALPFVSAGGSGLVITALAVGVLLNIARQPQLNFALADNRKQANDQ